jgi:hypothetical protein
MASSLRSTIRSSTTHYSLPIMRPLSPAHPSLGWRLPLVAGAFLLLAAFIVGGSRSLSADEPVDTDAGVRSLRDPLADHASPARRLIDLAELAEAHPDIVSLAALPGTEHMPAAPTLVTLALHDDARATAPADERPAVLVVGGLDAGFPLSTELAHRLVRRVVAGAETDEAMMERLRTTTLYVVPTLDQAGFVAAYNESPRAGRRAAVAPGDDDRDGLSNEDPADDLNGDGIITRMRVADPAGRWREHPDDPRVMVEARAADGETGGWLLLAEGRDDDGDERYNEDGDEGTILARHWPLDRDWNDPRSGIYPLQRPEAKALADFIVARENIAVIIALGPDDTLAAPTKGKDYANPLSPREPMEDWDSKDAAYLAAIAKEWRAAIGLADDAKVKMGEATRGTLVRYAYDARGRFAVAMGVWSPSLQEALEKGDGKKEQEAAVPESAPENVAENVAESAAVDSEEEANGAGDATREDTTPAGADEAAPGEIAPAPADAPDADAGTDAATDALLADADADDFSAPAMEAKPKQADLPEVAKEQAALLKWLDEHAPGSLVAWEAIEHPDFPGRRVEVGGVVPFATVTPPTADIDDFLNDQAGFLAALADRLPRIVLVESVVTMSAPGLAEVELTLRNDGGLPTVLRQGDRSDGVMPVWVTFDIADDRVVTGNHRNRLSPLAPGETATVRAIIATGDARQLGVRIRSAAAGQVSTSLTLPSDDQSAPVRRSHLAPPADPTDDTTATAADDEEAR